MSKIRQFSGLQLKSPKKKNRVKNYQELQQLAESDLDSSDLYQANLLDNFYPNRPATLHDICLHDGTTKEMMMQMVEDNMSNFRSQEFQITGYMTLTTLKNEKLTFTQCFYNLYRSLISHNWWVKVSQQKRHLTSIFENVL